MNPSTTGLVLEDYRLRRFATALTIDTTFDPGITVLLGTNGVGKTSLLRSLVQPELRAPGSRVRYRDEGNLVDLAEARPSLLPQRPRLPANLTVEETLVYCCRVRGADPAEARRQLDTLHLVGVRDRRALRLSGGQFQRLNLALTFVGSPQVALLDEPTVALDPLGRRSFARALREVADRAVVVMSTHVAADIEIADHVQVMDPGGVAWRGRPADFLALGDGSFDEAFARLLSRGAS